MKKFTIALLVLVLAIVSGSALASDEAPVFDDGRLNAYDLNAPVAIYTVDYGDGLGLDFWAPIGYEGAGKLVLRVTAEDIATVETNPESAIMIANSTEIGASLYRLPDGTFQILATTSESGTYSLVFEQMINHAGYTSDWLK